MDNSQDATPTAGEGLGQLGNNHQTPDQQAANNIKVQDYINNTARETKSHAHDASNSSANADGCSSAITSPTNLSSWSTSSDRQLGHGSAQDPEDRVFPIRSVISVDPAATPTVNDDIRAHRRMSLSEGYGTTMAGRSNAAAGTGNNATYTRPHASAVPTSRASAVDVEGRPTISQSQSSASQPDGSSIFGSSSAGTMRQQRGMNTMTGSLSSVQADAERHRNNRSIELALRDSSEEESDGGADGSGGGGDQGTIGSSSSSGRKSPDALPETHFTPRFKHVVTKEGHAVITGRDGQLQRCEDEPIHTPGAVQGFGLMVVIQEEQDGRFIVRFVSENSKRIIGYTPQELFRMNNFLDIFTDEQAENLLDHVDFIRDEDSNPAVNGPEVFSLSIRLPKVKGSVKLWCAMHVHPSHPELTICEFELDDDHDYPLRPPEEDYPDTPEDTLQSNPTTEELTESTEILSKPLRVLRSARRRRGEAGALRVFDIMSQVQEQLANAPNLEKFLKILVGIVKELTGFHRVMIYQFDSSFNGKVVTELVDPMQTRDLYRGLHFPATDIPKQARELYKLNKVRLLYDRDVESARIVCRTPEDLETPLDMTHSYLRAMSPIHLKYLANMAVRSSMSISINAFGDLWGLIACHSYGPKGMRVSFPIRKMCRLVGDTVSRNIERLSYASRLQARKLINTVPTDKNPSGYIIASSDDLLKLFDADFGMLSIREETKIMGKIEQSQEALALLEYLRVRRFSSVVTSQDVKIDFPDLRYPPGFQVIAGLLYVPLSVGGSDFIVFFRKGQVREVKWAGNPHEKNIQAGSTAYLEPRKSFKVWYETVIGKSRGWSEEQVETAAVLCLVYGKFIEVWRQKEAALQSSRLTRLLLANSAHEVRTPLNAIINYLEIALEGSLDQETRDNLARSHSASKSLIYVINDLLDLTKTEEGRDIIKDEVFDLLACMREATEPFRHDAKRKGITYEVIEHPGLPRLVSGDQRRIRQAVANVTANAVKHTSEGFVKIELYVAEVHDNRVRIEIVVKDSGKGMSNAQLDALFRELEQVDTDLEFESSDEHGDDKSQSGKTLGLGLAVVARILRAMDGQLRLKSEVGKGSRFVIQLPFDLPEEEKVRDAAAANSGHAAQPSIGSSNASVSAASMSTQMQDGEVMLVDRSNNGSSWSVNNASSSLASRKSYDDSQSIASKGSGRSQRSGADRLIGAIQNPLTLGEPESESVSRQRRVSRGPYHGPASSHLGPSKGRSVSPGSRKRPDAPARSVSSPNTKKVTPRSQKPTIEVAEHSEPPAASQGLQYVTDSRVPIKPVKLPDEMFDKPVVPPPSTSKVLFEIKDPVAGKKAKTAPRSAVKEPPRSVPLQPPAPVTSTPAQPPQPAKEASVANSKLQVLVAEDDPINVKVLRKRLEKAGYKVTHALNGEDCAAVYEAKPMVFDVVLMDMQMPIVDGLTSSKMIRAFEKSTRHGNGQQLSAIASDHGRVPIFAVSASLVEHEKDTYVEAGFDGWILKPIDFKRLETLLEGITDDKVRNDALYVSGQWERGGWFGRKGMGHMGQEQQIYHQKEHREREKKRGQKEQKKKEDKQKEQEQEEKITSVVDGDGGETQPEPPKKSMLDV
ncbi:hypothetical protein QBC32DRAFT_202007 [Pseudoneurospora amorphoporcata]|uniref:Phytochrome n=1 Tax=Pseudoneurospora amorphoporcata TaxID=241081 RepID=A0AAN6P4U9_9PEZI|nr:hypothetical protein QBC32DRAFT_202007 [Pseudoneurospora amorphoporcata]